MITQSLSKSTKRLDGDIQHHKTHKLQKGDVYRSMRKLHDDEIKFGVKLEEKGSVLDSQMSFMLDRQYRQMSGYDYRVQTHETYVDPTSRHETVRALKKQSLSHFLTSDIGPRPSQSFDGKPIPQPPPMDPSLLSSSETSPPRFSSPSLDLPSTLPQDHTFPLPKTRVDEARSYNRYLNLTGLPSKRHQPPPRKKKKKKKGVRAPYQRILKSYVPIDPDQILYKKLSLRPNWESSKSPSR